MQVNVVFWKTYMPPPHLLSIPAADVEAGKVLLRDYAGASNDEVAHFLHGLTAFTSIATGPGPLSLTYLVTPPHAFDTLPWNRAKCFTEETLLYPHLDLDHVEESLAVGWPRGLTLGVYVADSSCLS